MAGVPIEIVPDREARSLAQLPRLPFPAREIVQLAVDSEQVILSPRDGRRLAWRHFVHPRPLLLVMLSLRPADLLEFESWLADLPEPAIAFEEYPGEGVEPYRILGEIRYDHRLPITDVRMQLLHLVWTDDTPLPP